MQDAKFALNQRFKCLKTKDYKGAIGAFTKAIVTYPPFVAALLHRGKVHRLQHH